MVEEHKLHEEMEYPSLPPRFVVIRQLGEGSFGQVYHANDLDKGMPVALKVLKVNQAGARSLFHNEFRSVQGLDHPNLVKLYELFDQDGLLFYTMELVEGVPFDVYTRKDYQEQDHLAPQLSDGRLSALVEGSSLVDFVGPAALFNERTITLDLDSLANEALAEVRVGSSPSHQALPQADALAEPTFDEGRLRMAFRALVAGVTKLHQEQRIHRDLKPGNVMVTEEGQLKILDFGLVSRNSEDSHKYQQQDGYVGTPEYMPPYGEQPTEAGDWYSVGVMLYQALTGRLPFTGTRMEILHRERHAMPPRPGEWVRGLPEDLEDICMALLATTPEKRLGGEQLAQQLGISDTPHLPRSVFVGRDNELAQLEDALKAMLHGHPQVVCIEGESGVGKSTTISRFLRQVRALEREEVVSFSVHCYEQESIPYRAMSPFIDQLCRYLHGLSSAERASILPHDRSDLLLVFPAFGQLHELRMEAEVGERWQAQERRQRAFTALRELLHRLTQRKKVIVFLDDLQWLDEESALLLEALMKPTQALCLVLLLSFRSEDAQSNTYLQQLLKMLSSSSTGLSLTKISVTSLPNKEASTLLTQMLADGQPTGFPLDQLLEDAKGSPLLLRTFAQYVRSKLAQGATEPSTSYVYTLDAAFQALLAPFDLSSRELLDFLAIAKQPMSFPLLRQVMGRGAAWKKEIHQLRDIGLLRTLRSGKSEEVGLYHSQLRAYLLDAMPEERAKTLHLRLASGLKELQEQDLERKAYHYYHAGHRDKAISCLLEAARSSRQMMAFVHAARLMSLILAWGEQPAYERIALTIQLAEDHANSGYTRLSADAYLQAAAIATNDEDTLSYQEKAAEQLLFSGEIDKALALFQRVFASLQLTFPMTSQEAEPKILWHRLRLRWQWMYAKPDTSATPSPQMLAKIDASYALSLIFGSIDPVRAIYFQMLFLRHALEAQEPERFALALIIEGLYRSIQDEGHVRKHSALIEQGINMAKRLEQPRIQITARATLGFIDFIQGRWQQAYQHFEACEAYIRAHQIHVWEKSAGFVYKMNSLLFMGNYDKIGKQLPTYIEEASERGDTFTATFLRWGVQTRWMVALDRPDDALSIAAQASQDWAHSAFDLQRYIEMLVCADIALYQDRPNDALEILMRCKEPLAHLRLAHSPFHQIELNYVHGRAHLALLCLQGPKDPGTAQGIAKIEESCAAIDALYAWGSGLSLLLRAGLASFRANQEDAIDLLIAAETRLQSFGMQLHAQIAQLCWGMLLEDERGTTLRTSATEALTTLGIQAPDKIARMLAPGRWTPLDRPMNPSKLHTHTTIPTSAPTKE